LFFRTILIEEKANKNETDIKIEKDFIEDYEFEGTIFNKNDISEFITRMNLDKISNIKKKPLICNVSSRTFFYLYKLQIHKKSHTRDNHHKCYICN